MSDDLYFIRSGHDGPVKIGRAARPAGRLRELQTGSPFPLHLLGTIPGGGHLERDLHARFNWLRIRGEWFRPDKTLLSYIVDRGGNVDPVSIPTPEPPPRELRPDVVDVAELHDSIRYKNQLIAEGSRIFENATDEQRHIDKLVDSIRELEVTLTAGSPSLVASSAAHERANRMFRNIQQRYHPEICALMNLGHEQWTEWINTPRPRNPEPKDPFYRWVNDELYRLDHDAAGTPKDQEARLVTVLDSLGLGRKVAA
jgi:Meiotically up-regulated gene 113